MKNFVWAIALCFACANFAQNANADLIIAGAVDGTQTGGNPKLIKFKAVNPIADLSLFHVLRDTNGSTGGTFTVSSLSLIHI